MGLGLRLSGSGHVEVILGVIPFWRRLGPETELIEASVVNFREWGGSYVSQPLRTSDFPKICVRPDAEQKKYDGMSLC